MKTFDAFDENDMTAFEAEAKVGLLATVNPDGLPHITFISSIRARDPKRLIWGQFAEGLSKKHVKTQPKTGFLILTLDRRLWRGKALWTHEEKQGPEYEMYNNTPMFRYNSYFGIHTVHFMDLVETYGREGLPMARIVVGSLLTMAAKSAARAEREEALTPWGRELFGKLGALRFMAYIGDDGFPVVFPLLQTGTADGGRLVFSAWAFGRELAGLKPGCPAAAFALTMDMENLLLRGTFQGFSRYRGVRLGVMDIDWVYNSMPPVQGQVYPATALEPVTDF